MSILPTGCANKTLNLVDTLDRLLPQTQCQRCGYPACRPYALALAQGQSEPNRCPPGGQQGANALAAVLGCAPMPLDLSRGRPGVPMQARVIEALCIGCTKCIRACPVDAIIGGNKRLHHVIAERCTGCELCLPPCPTDCIEMIPRPTDLWHAGDAGLARERFEARNRRLEAEAATTSPTPSHERSPAGTDCLMSAAPGKPDLASAAAPCANGDGVQQAVHKALEAARQRLAQRQPNPER